MVDDDDWAKKQPRPVINNTFPPKLKIGAKILAEETEEETSDNERQQVLRDLYQLDMQNEDVESVEFRRKDKKRRKRTNSVRQDIVILE